VLDMDTSSQMDTTDTEEYPTLPVPGSIPPKSGKHTGKSSTKMKK